MKRKIWDLYAPIYSRAMRAEERSYAFLYRRIPKWVRAKEVLELATGPGVLAKRIAPVTERMLATDYSEGMIAEAKKGACPKNLRFEVADALSLPYADAPNFVKKRERLVGRCWEAVLGLVGVRFEHQWTAGEYLAFFRDNGWEPLFYKEMQARMPFLYVECRRS